MQTQIKEFNEQLIQENRDIKNYCLCQGAK